MKTCNYSLGAMHIFFQLLVVSFFSRSTVIAIRSFGKIFVTFYSSSLRLVWWLSLVCRVKVLLSLWLTTTSFYF